MSDVAIRFDGLLLLASLVVATGFYLSTALVAGIGTLLAMAARPRWRFVRRTALLLGLLNLAALVATALYIEYSGQPTGPDIVDWLAIPATIFFAIGCAALFRTRSGGANCRKSCPSRKEQVKR